MPKPFLGQVVPYTVTAADADAINQRRQGTAEHLAFNREGASGVQVYLGNTVAEGDVYPLIVTRIWDDSDNPPCNGQLLLDGNDTYWVTQTHVA